MKVFMTGGTGFVGSYLAGFLINKGHAVTILTSFPESPAAQIAGVGYLPGNPTKPGDWQDAVGEHD
ncbi:MAG: NAD(P)-dependent oxidoreductase, partial [Deltaproteobacteria bacterium]|nr:NAD(P)-dependent oxidoreductase [Deltaproteobacteria bacterium]